MAFAQWQADPSDENAQALDDAEAARSQAEINSQQAKEAYEDKKVNQPKMPEYADYSNSQNSSQSDLFTDGTEGSGQGAADQEVAQQRL